jgi:hypothetical protein
MRDEVETEQAFDGATRGREDGVMFFGTSPSRYQFTRSGRSFDRRVLSTPDEPFTRVVVVITSAGAISSELARDRAMRLSSCAARSAKYASTSAGLRLQGPHMPRPAFSSDSVRSLEHPEQISETFTPPPAVRLPDRDRDEPAQPARNHHPPRGGLARSDREAALDPEH